MKKMDKYLCLFLFLVGVGIVLSGCVIVRM
ncbi:hypothetical protein IGI58_000085 [Enterococcus sp. AZ020]|uniref:Lipoprotein n=1 Tax=Candidatus Enterococcus dunnyi TaxID=1834192 RepID=A0A200JGF7_9ENTE|nr:hypothetical protein A5889_001241 [Enterococcus sp. 9D6_DIV0238]